MTFFRLVRLRKAAGFLAQKNKKGCSTLMADIKLMICGFDECNSIENFSWLGGDAKKILVQKLRVQAALGMKSRVFLFFFIMHVLFLQLFAASVLVSKQSLTVN